MEKTRTYGPPGSSIDRNAPLSKGGEGGLVIDVGGSRAVLASTTGGTRGTGGTTSATLATTGTVTATVTTAAATASTTVGALEAGIDLEEDLLLLLGLGLGGALGLSDKVIDLSLLLVQGDGTLPEIVTGALVGLANALELRNGGLLGLLLSSVLLEGEGVVLLLLFLAGLARGSGALSGSSLAFDGGGNLGSCVGVGSLLLLELGVALIASPALVDLLLGIGLSGGGVLVEGTPASTGSTTTAAARTSTASTLELLLAVYGSILSGRSSRAVLGSRLSTTGVVLATSGGRTGLGLLLTTGSSGGGSGGGSSRLSGSRAGRPGRVLVVEKRKRVSRGHRHCGRCRGTFRQ